MTAAGCRAALESCEVNHRATVLDQAYPQCACEEWSLCEGGGLPVGDEEKIARILTSPDGYDENAFTIATQKLTALYSMGLSVVRQGASDEEILSTIDDLLSGGEEERKLVGAIVVEASELRSYADPSRWLGVYATDDRGKAHHVDVFGTIPAGGSSARDRVKKQRRYKLAEDLVPKIVFANDNADLIARLRAEGI